MTTAEQARGATIPGCDPAQAPRPGAREHHADLPPGATPVGAATPAGPRGALDEGVTGDGGPAARRAGGEATHGATRASAPDADLAHALPNPLRSAALARPEHPLLVAPDRTWTARDLALAVARRARVLVRRGVGPGDLVALAGPPGGAWVVDLHALGWLGAAVAPLPWPPRAPAGALAGAASAEAARALAASGAGAWLAAGDDADVLAALEAAAPRAAAAREEGAPARALRPPEAAEAADGGGVQRGGEPAERFWPLDEPRLVVLTSGSTGAPRPVVLRTGQLAWSAFGSAVRLGHDPDDRWLLALPLHHVAGLMVLVRCAFYGTTAVLHDRFEPGRVAEALDAGEATLVSLTPALLERVLDARPARPFPPSLRAVLLGGGPTSPALLERCRRLALPVARTWGLTEAASQVATCRPGDLEPGCGPPLPFARVEATGEGALVVRGPLARGALVTADRGRVDRTGRVHVLGRRDATIVRAGLNVDPREVEAALEAHEGVLEAGVAPVADVRLGQATAAVVVARAPGLEAAALRAWCRVRLPAGRGPDHVLVLAQDPGPGGAPAALPRTALGKLARPALARLAAARLAAEHPDAAGQGGAAAPEDVPEDAPGEPSRRPEAGVPDGPGARLAALAREAGVAGVAARLHAALELLGPDVTAVADELTRVGAARPPAPPGARAGAPEDPGAAAWAAARHLLDLPGKRLRPLALLLAARLGGRAADAGVRDLAVAAELVHAATLLHDDVIDEGEQRRGAPTSRALWGNPLAVLGGDLLLVDALRRVDRFVGAPGGGARAPEVRGWLLDTIHDMVAAEALQLARRGRLEVDRAAALRVIEGKTGALFRWALAAGGAAGGLEPADTARLARAGAHLGVAFQLQDDVLDLTPGAALGKDPGADVREGKLTWPLLLAAERDAAVLPLLRALGGAPGQPDAEDAPAPGRAGLLEALHARLAATRALEDTRAEARARAAAARGELSGLPAGLARDALEAVVVAAVERTS